MALICAAIMVVIVFPMLYMLLNSLMSPAEISGYYSGEMRFHLIPDTISFDSYYRILLSTPDYLHKFWNSMLLSGTIVLLQFAVSCMTGFALAKYKFKARKLLFFSLIVLMLLPLQAVIVPNYILFDRVGLLDTWWPLIASGAFTPFGAVLMAQTFKSVFLAYFNRQNLALSFSCGILSLLPGFLLFLYYRDELAEGIDFSLRSFRD
jgi:multiple sugar transport system permease protein